MTRACLILLFTMLLFPTLVNANKNIKLDHNFQRPGGDYSRFRVANANECAEKCEISSRCQAFDFYHSDHSCWLKHMANPGRDYAGVVSGAKKFRHPKKQTTGYNIIKLDYDTRRPGGDYTRFQTPDVQQCSQSCTQDPQCAAFDYTASDDFCYLKSYVPPSSGYRGIISGVKKRYSPQVRKVQRLLKKQNYNPGPTDGLMGRKTRIALNNYQMNHNLLMTGIIDEATLISLGLIQPPRQMVEVIVANEEQEQYRDTKFVPKTRPMTAPKENIVNEEFSISIRTVGVTYLQAEDNIYASILAKIPSDIVLHPQAIIGDWYKISYQNKEGYILSESVDIQ